MQYLANLPLMRRLRKLSYFLLCQIVSKESVFTLPITSLLKQHGSTFPSAVINDWSNPTEQLLPGTNALCSAAQTSSTCSSGRISSMLQGTLDSRAHDCSAS